MYSALGISEKVINLANEAEENIKDIFENIEKIDANKDIIYPITMVKNEASYEMDLNIPVFNITGDAPAEFNNTTQQSFINKANQIMTGENTNSQNSGDVKPNTNQNTNNVTNINGQTYIFDNRGRMLTGWVAKDTDSNAYLEIGDENSDYYLKQFTDVYFCGDEDDGHAKKNKWFKTWRPSEYDAEDDDNDQYWYSIDKNGKVYIPSQSNASKLAYGVKYKLKDAKLEAQNSGATIEFTKKNVNSKSYFFNQDGEMLSQFIEVSADNLGADSGLKAGMYYFGGDDDGSMKTGSQSVKDDNGDSYKFFFENKTTGNTKGLGITGNKSGYLYFKGLLIKADDYKYQLATITDENGVEHTFIVNKNGSIQKNRVDYKEDNEVLFTTKNLPKDAFVTDSTAWKYSLKDGLTVEDDITTPIDIYDVMPQN